MSRVVYALLVCALGVPAVVGALDQMSTLAEHPTITTDQTPMEERWGGWYVTGTHGSERHAGNVMAPALAHEIGAVKPYLEIVTETKPDLAATKGW